MKNENEQPESTYSPLERPTFVSDIPSVLYKDSTEAERYILDQLSITKQFIAWSVEAQLSTHAAVRRTNGRVIALEQWRDMFKSWWMLTGGVLALVGGVAGAVEIVEFVKAHFLMK